MPEFLYYVTLSQGYQQFYLKDQKDKVRNFSVYRMAVQKHQAGPTFLPMFTITGG
jgi:hypothetical protein